MDKQMIRKVVIAVIAVAVSSTALGSRYYQSERDDYAIRKCMNAVRHDGTTPRLRYTGQAWINGPKDGQMKVFVNAITRGASGTEHRKVACDLTATGARVLAANVEPGRFVDRATS